MTTQATLSSGSNTISQNFNHKSIFDDLEKEIDSIKGMQARASLKLDEMDNVARKILQRGKEVEQRSSESYNQIKHIKTLALDSKEKSKKIHQTSLKLTKLVENVFKNLEESKDETSAAFENLPGLEKAKASLDELKTLLNTYNSYSSAIEKKAKKGKTSSPHLAKDTQKLSQKFSELNEKLVKIMTEAQDPIACTNILALEEEIEAKDKEFKDLLLDYQNLVRPVYRKLGDIEERVKRHANDNIPEDHYGSIAILNRCTSKDVADSIDRRNQLNAERITRHNELSIAWQKVLIGKETIEWELQRLIIFANVHSEVSELNNKLSSLHGNIDSIKTRLREKNSVDKREVEKLYKVYNKLAEEGKRIKESAETTITDLIEARKKGGTALKEELAKVNTYDLEAKQKINESAELTINTLQEERKALLDPLKTNWNTVYKRLNTHNSSSYRDSLAYQLTRVCYAIEENDGALPTDSFFTWSWMPKREPVQSPWAEPEALEEETSSSEESAALTEEKVEIDSSLSAQENVIEEANSENS